jgi:vesicle-fusing ATPase
MREEVRLTFGVSEEDHNIDDTIKKGEIFIEGVGQASGDRALTSLLLHGPAGSGKTALAALIALQSNLPFVRLISLEGHVGMSETYKITAIENCFLSPLSVIVIDSIGILEWVQIGPRFSTSLLQAVETRSRKTPPKAADC